MPKTDTVEDTDPVDLENAERGEQVDTQTPGDTTAARSQTTDDKSKAGGDDPVAENDPLVLARKGPPEKAPKPAKKTPAAPKAVEDPPADDQPPEAASEPAPAAEDQPVDEPAVEAEEPDTGTDPLLSANLSEDAWAKLNHKDKSTFLGVRKLALAKAKEAVQAKREAATVKEQATKVRGDYEAVEKFVSDQGLDPDSYRNSVIVAGMVARGDARALPLLEESVKALRRSAGIAEPTPPAAPVAPTVDADELLSLITEAETSFDFDKLKARVAKLKEKPAAPAAPAIPQPAPAPAARLAPPQGDPVEAHANGSVRDFLLESGVPVEQVIPTLERLVRANPALARVPATGRLRAVMQAFKAARPPAQPTPKPQPKPISGRGRTGGGGQSQPANQDPLVRARTTGSPESRGGL